VLRGFGRRSDIACVTGLVASASLERPSEQYFDARVTWSSSCVAAVFDADRCARGRGLFPYAAGQFGTGANVAFRADALRDTGGFDEALGAGSACAGGEDLDIFVRMLRAGHSIAYEPAALVWHEHRASDNELRGQMYAYGKGLSAYLFKYACSRRTAWDVLRRVPFGLVRLASLGRRASSAGERASCGRGLLIAEARGWLAGPFAYRAARRRQDPANARAVAP
jgi:GT2 family glycosyltransferase